MKLFDIISEDGELDEVGPQKTKEQLIDDLKVKFPNWDYSNADIYKSEDGRKRIKNVYCKIHDHSFPEEGRSEGIRLDQHIAGTGCDDCRHEVVSKQVAKRNSYSEEKWKEILNNNKNFDNRYNFSKAKFSYVEPLAYGPLVTHIYCNVHKKYFKGGIKNDGIRANLDKREKYICPDCYSDFLFTNKALSEDQWIDKFKSNERNVNYDYSKSKVEYNYKDDSSQGIAKVYNIKCTVKGLNGKPHGLYAKDGIDADLHVRGWGQCPKCICESKQIEFLKASTKEHGDTYLYDKVDFCAPDAIDRRITSTGEQYNVTKVLIGCKEHGYFFQDVQLHKRGSGCPICRASKGEKYISNLLNSKFGGKYKIERENNLGFEMLGDKKFDFYIPELKVAIEYDGEAHFWPIFGTSEYSRNISYIKMFESDNLKNNFIKSKKNNSTGIGLIRIPYTMEFNEIDKPLLDAIRNVSPNTITYLGEYPRRHNRKEVQSKFKLNESKLSLIDVLKS